MREGQRKLVTVLFADLVGFTSLGDVLDPEALHDVMTSLFRRLADHVRAYGGFVEKYIGDAMMSVFGVPIVHEDDAERAARAAIAIHQTVGEFSQEWTRRLNRSISVRIGLNSGLVVAGSVGEGRATDYGVMGDVVNIAARFQQAANPGQTVIGELTRQLVDKTYASEALAPLTLKGKPEPIQAYRLIGEREAPAALVGPFIGRDDQIMQLRLILDRIVAGESVSIGITGPPGVGKTRLVEEARRIGPPSVAWVIATCPAHLQNHPYGVVSRLVQTLAHAVLSGCSTNESCHQLARLCGDVGDVLAPAVIDHVLGLRAGLAGALDHLSPDNRRHLTNKVLGALLPRLVTQPTVIAIDGCQWLDAFSAEVVGLAGAGTHLWPMGLVFVYRSDWLPTENLPITIELGGFSREEAARLISAEIGADNAIGAIVDKLWTHTGGNPLFLTELARALGSQPFTDADVPLPPSIHTMLSARLDQLDDDVRRIAQIGALTGPVFRLETIQAVLSDENLDVAGAANRLEKLEIVTRTNDLMTYEFQQHLFAEVAYETLLMAVRRRLHGRVGRWLETASDSDVGTICYHFRRSSDHARAAHYLRLLGDEQRQIGEYVTAIATYREALARLDQVVADGECGSPPGSPAIDPTTLGGVLLKALGNALEAVGDFSDAYESYEQALAKTPTGSARIELVRRMAEVWAACGDRDEALSLLGEAEQELAAGLQSAEVDDTLQALAALHASAAAIELRQESWTNACREAEQAFETLSLVTAQAHTSAQFRLALDVHLIVARAQIALGRYSQANDHCQSARRAAEEIKDLPGQVRVNAYLGTLATYHGDLDAAVGLFEEARTLASRIGDRSGEALAVENLAEVAEIRGDLRARDLYDWACSRYQTVGDRSGVERCQQALRLLTSVPG